MAIKIYNLDWRSTDALVSSQETTINNFIANKTIQNVAAVDEFLIARYNNNAPTRPPKVKIYKIVERIQAIGINSTETEIQNFINTNVTSLISILNLDSGTILFVYD